MNIRQRYEDEKGYNFEFFKGIINKLKKLGYEAIMCSIEIVDGSGRGTSTGSAHVGHATGGSGHTSRGATGSLVDSHHDGVELSFELLLLFFESGNIGITSRLEPLEDLLGGLGNEGLVFFGELVLHLLVIELVLHLEAVVLESVFLLNSVLDLVILILELLSISDEFVNFLLGETALIIGDGNLLVLTGSFIHGRDVEDTVGIDIEGNLNLGSTSGSWGNSFKVEFTELMVVLGHSSLSFEDLDEDTGLVVSVGGEGLGLLGGDGSVSGDEVSHDTTGGLDTLGKRGDIEEEHVLDGLVSLSTEDGSLDSSTVGNSLIGVDGLVEDLSVEEVGEHGLNLGDSGGSSNEDNLVNLSLGHVGILKDVLYWGHALSELGNAELFESSSGHVVGEIFTIGKGLALNHGLMGGREGSLGLLALGSESSEGSVVSLDVDLGLLLELLNAELDEDVIEIFSSEMGVSVGSFDLEDTILNGEEGDIEGTTTEIEDKDVSLLSILFVETVSNGGSGGLVDDSLDVHSSDGSSILGGLSLGIVEVSGDSDNSVGNFLAEVGLSDFLHLDEDHGGDLFSLEFLLFSLESDNNHGLLTDSGLDLEGPELGIGLDILIRELASNESLGIEDSVGGVSGDLVLGGFSNESLVFSEGDVRGGGVETLIVSDDLNLIVLPDTNA